MITLIIICVINDIYDKTAKHGLLTVIKSVFLIFGDWLYDKYDKSDRRLQW